MSEQRRRFQRRVEELVARFETDLDRGEWILRRYPKRFRDESLEVFEIPALYMQKGPTSLLLDPIGYDIPGAEGAVDIYQMPAYDPMVTLYFEGGRWIFHYPPPRDDLASPPKDEPQGLPLSAETINQVLDSIIEHAVSPI
jgi:hypothetical protein